MITPVVKVFIVHQALWGVMYIWYPSGKTRQSSKVGIVYVILILQMREVCAVPWYVFKEGRMDGRKENGRKEARRKEGQTKEEREKGRKEVMWETKVKRNY